MLCFLLVSDLMLFDLLPGKHVELTRPSYFLSYEKNTLPSKCMYALSELHSFHGDTGCIVVTKNMTISRHGACDRNLPILVKAMRFNFQHALVHTVYSD